MGVVLFILIFLIVAMAVFYLATRKRAEVEPDGNDERPANILQFYLRGNELGFKLSELRNLHKLAVRFGIGDPNNLLLSWRTMDRCLKEIVRSPENIYDDPKTVDLLFKVFEYRMGVEKSRPKYRRAMASSRTIAVGQQLKLHVKDIGVYATSVVENSRESLSVEFPTTRGLPPGFTWKGHILEVYFWKRGDAQYYFDTIVLNDPDKTALVPHLRLAHSDELLRTQKRESIRVSVMKDAYLIPLESPEQANEIFLTNQGYLCKVIDISETGAAIVVRGKVKPGHLVKLQVELGTQEIVMCGEVKAVNLNQNLNASLLHLEANPPLSKAMRIKVMAYVLGFLTLEVPKEVVEGEGQAVTGPGQAAEDGQESAGTAETQAGSNAGSQSGSQNQTRGAPVSADTRDHDPAALFEEPLDGKN